MMRFVFCILLFVTVCTQSLFASSSEHGEEFDATEMIMHHIGDSHEWHIISLNSGKENEIHITLPLPVILWHEGLHIFLSSKFHKEKVVSIGNSYVVYEHEKIYLTDANGTLAHDEEGHITNAKPWDFSITKNVVSMFLSIAILLLIFISAAKSYKKRGALSAPKGIQNVAEYVLLFVRDDIIKAQIHDSRKVDFFAPYLLTLFFFIIINNLIGLVPFFPGGSNLSGNISFTLTLAVISFLAINVFAPKAYWKHLFLAPGVPGFVKFILVPVEFIGLFTKPFALTLRLFANITAGHIIILSLTAMIFVLGSIGVSPISILLTLIMYCLEFLVAFLQAYIFTLLTSLFIGMAVNESH